MGGTSDWCGPESCYRAGDEGECCITCDDIKRIFLQEYPIYPITGNFSLAMQCQPPVFGTAGGTVHRNQGCVSCELCLIENAPIVWNVPSARRAQEGNIFDQDPTNANTVENGVATQAEFGILDQIKSSTNKQGR